jgi:stringent starvation protein B
MAEDIAPPSTKPYLIRAIHEWCMDNGFRPFVAVVVDATTVVPREFVRNGEIVLNVSTQATNRLQLGNSFVEFEARFGGVARQVSIPVENISAIYAAENGQGMAFDVVRKPESDEGPAPVKAELIEDDSPPAATVSPVSLATGLKIVSSSPEADPPDGEEPGPPDTPRPGGDRPRLTRIK